VSDIIIGIDLGTTNSEVAVVQHGRPRILGVDGAKLLPSVVGLADDGALLVGQTARNQYTLYPERTIRSVKRRMGEDVHLSMGEQSFRPQEISALILKRLKRAAEEDLGQPGREGRDHGAGLLLRCPAPGHARCRRAGGPEGRAHHQ
jgi:molecular chaperone DnaK (HSP70)